VLSVGQKLSDRNNLDDRTIGVVLLKQFAENLYFFAAVFNVWLFYLHGGILLFLSAVTNTVHMKKFGSFPVFLRLKICPEKPWNLFALGSGNCGLLFAAMWIKATQSVHISVVTSTRTNQQEHYVHLKPNCSPYHSPGLSSRSLLSDAQLHLSGTHYLHSSSTAALTTFKSRRLKTYFFRLSSDCIIHAWPHHTPTSAPEVTTSRCLLINLLLIFYY